MGHRTMTQSADAHGTCNDEGVNITENMNPPAGQVIMYSTTWCGYCNRLKTQLDRVGVSYTVVDIEDYDDAADWVQDMNGGNRTVPTLRFADGSALTNPSAIQVQARLAELAAL